MEGEPCSANGWPSVTRTVARLPSNFRSGELKVKFHGQPSRMNHPLTKVESACVIDNSVEDQAG